MRCWAVFLWLLLGNLILLGCASCASPDRGRPHFIYGPYKDITLAFDSSTRLLSTEIQGQLVPVVKVIPKEAVLSWGFAKGECGTETLGGFEPAVVSANIEAFGQAGVGYIISTGGEGGTFTCGSEVGMEAFIRRYDAPGLVGIDFDIEAGQTPEQIQALVRSVKAVQKGRPQLRFSFTLATHAAVDGSRRSLNALGETVLSAIRLVGLTDFRLNLMVMNYGPPEAAFCVPEADRCAMGRSALQAAENVSIRYGVPYAQIELTAMLGENDVAANVFTQEDAEMLARFARERGLGGFHYWSLDRDAPCSPGSPRVSAACSGMSAPTGAFGRAFAAGLR